MSWPGGGGRRRRRNLLTVVLGFFLLLATNHFTMTTAGASFPLTLLGSWFGFHRRASKNENGSRVDDGDDSSAIPITSSRWSSLLTIDPSELLSTIVDNGGLFIPDYIDKDIHIMRKAIHCQKAQLNIITRDVVLTNFTIGLNKKEPLMRIGRIKVHWDSYTNPVIFIELDLVDVAVEFTNLILTESNWQELAKIGFPPQFLLATEEEVASNNKRQKESIENDSWIRIGSIDLSGNVTMRISSRPLSRALGSIYYDMKALQDMSVQIKKQSRHNYVGSGRLGLTPLDLSTLLQSYFVQKVQDFVSSQVHQIMTVKPTDQLRADTDQFLEQASDAILNYAVDATAKFAENVETAFEKSRWNSKLKSWFSTMNKTVEELLK